MLAKEMCQEIRKQLKVKGYTSRQVSVRCRDCGYSEAIDVTIKDLSVPYTLVSEIANQYEEIRRDEASGEILEGANTYVDVSFDSDAVDKEREKYMQYAKEIIEKYKNTPEGQLETLAKSKTLELLYSPTWSDGCGRVIEICEVAKYDYNGEKGTYLKTIKRYDAHNDYCIAEALVYITNQYDIKINLEKELSLND